MSTRAGDPVNDFVRNRIRRLRRSKNLSTRQLAALSGIPEGSYCCLEGGSYRISLHNLQKIMQALGGSIHDVWPQPEEPFKESPPRLSELPQVNYDRFREICSLTEARGAALLSRHGGRLELMFENDLKRAERGKLLKALTQRHSPGKGWLIYEKSTRGNSVCLALHHALVEGRLGVLLHLYLDLWLATQAARLDRLESGDGNRMAEARGHQK